MTRRLIALLVVGLAVIGWPAPVQAHAHLVRADLAPNGHYLVSVGTVRFWFDEPLNPALTRVVVLAAGGREVNVDDGQLNPGDHEELDLTLPTLPNGLYSVRWTSESAQDGHVMHGFYLFTVGGVGATVPGTTGTAVAAGGGPALDTAGVLIALAHWLVLLATVVWTGALALQVLVLTPVRAGVGPASALAEAASARALVVTQGGLLLTIAASALELETQAGAAGGWSGVTSGSVVGSLLSSSYGTWFLARLGLIVLLLVVAGYAAGGASVVLGSVPVAPGVALAAPLGAAAGRAAAVLGLLYLLGLALGGHAAALPRLTITAVVLDWVHLIATSVWIGGMVAIVLIVLPASHQLGDLLDLLDRFSPAAILALAAAACTGMFNAQVRLGSLQDLLTTTYGRLLLVKLALIGVIMLISASHVLATRPRLRRRAPQEREGSRRDWTLLALQLRGEACLGLGVLLCVALMGQVAPAAAVFGGQVVQAAGGEGTSFAAAPIAAAGQARGLAVTLRIDHPDVGSIAITATVTEAGRPVTNGQVRVKLAMPATPDLGAAFVETTAQDSGYSGVAALVQPGVWTADVLVRTPSDPGEYRDVPFVFVAGPFGTFLTAAAHDPRFGPAVVRLAGSGGTGTTLSVHLRGGLHVRYRVTMPDMPSQVGDLAERAGGWYEGLLVPSMEGYINVTVLVEQKGLWLPARILVCSVDGNYQMQVII